MKNRPGNFTRRRFLAATAATGTVGSPRVQMGDWLRKIPPLWLDVDAKLATMDATGIARTGHRPRRRPSRRLRGKAPFPQREFCSPTRSVLRTGQHTGHTRIRGNHGRAGLSRVPLKAEDITVAEVLKSAGYATAIAGKWGLGEPGTEGIPNRQGFDHWFGYLNNDLADAQPAFVARAAELFRPARTASEHWPLNFPTQKKPKP